MERNWSSRTAGVFRDFQRQAGGRGSGALGAETGSKPVESGELGVAGNFVRTAAGRELRWRSDVYPGVAARCGDRFFSASEEAAAGQEATRPTAKRCNPGDRGGVLRR